MNRVQHKVLPIVVGIGIIFFIVITNSLLL